jgi:diacylglycerol kinase family enzyme
VDKGVIFLNSSAGSFPAQEQAALESAAAEAGLEVVHVSKEISVEDVIRTALAAKRRNIVVCGGDGSINHVAQALVRTDGILGIIPLGTFNHLARDLRIPFDWRAAFEIATKGEVHQIDVGRANETYFLNTAMAGMYPTISQYRERFRSTHSKWRAYAKGARAALRHFHSVKLGVEIDGHLQKMETPMFAVLVNSYDVSKGGVPIPRLSFDDGRLTLMTLDKMGRFEFALAAARYLRGRLKSVAGFKSVRCKRIRIDSAHHRVRMGVDGELMYFKPPVLVEIIPASLLMRMPPGHSQRS